MASPSTVLSRGYGSWGSVNLLPTRGYGIGVSSPITLVGHWENVIAFSSANELIDLTSANKTLEAFSSDSELEI